MARSRPPGGRDQAPGLIALALALVGLVASQQSLSLPPLWATTEHYTYLPLAARPVPTPTPTPTVTPIPSPSDVRIDPSCSSFKGGSAQDPTGECVCLRSYDPAPVNMAGWYVKDEKDHLYTFGHFILQPGATVRLHSGRGQDEATDLYWGSGLIWNNDHDTVFLWDALNRLIATYGW